jgi:chaperonin cofactor prefoldin
VPELKKLLDKAEDKIKTLEAKIRILTKQVKDLGGELMSDKDMEKAEL